MRSYLLHVTLLTILSFRNTEIVIRMLIVLSLREVMSSSAPSHRSTTREEDRAYSLLALLGVHVPIFMLYGENTFRHLQFGNHAHVQ
ncbi:hypothetical protein F5J12DRAFT_822388 [Pisolithus orientalis]|uniref:uncharacterized protein n=1 Tax=Pisolithus orientalis TaxID=936130 RepID=UPI0022240790|nr:uncharacterized protein F5J12DRAFT_822388 [Pisolithus orientalis]KAI6010894.1 hypothetical protein F5J12DRAFT_822388 [Pisolithus orientalis]